ncbi:Thiamine pyrophosphate enzyme [Parasponia andersonii]|uniref:Thiamine pyrophosphate enzyme n=1 Tax=Parasponia andersonii TaxID=3476 RepID=A0A2P5DVI5_PARAD|nr:Thiamine pyrophosphate enzyme [Parasponia andersonii]
MLAMAGSVYANYAIDKCDLLLAFRVKLDDGVIGKLDAFSSQAKIVHIDIDSTEIELDEQKEKYSLSFKTFGEAITHQYAIYILDEFTSGNAIISTEGFRAMSFCLPATMRAMVANPDSIISDIDGNGSFIMNV